MGRRPTCSILDTAAPHERSRARKAYPDRPNHRSRTARAACSDRPDAARRATLGRRRTGAAGAYRPTPSRPRWPPCGVCGRLGANRRVPGRDPARRRARGGRPVGFLGAWGRGPRATAHVFVGDSQSPKEA
jgi:hypothetical protein